MPSLKWDLSQRDALRERVTRVLEADPRVASVELKGSLGRGTADVYSDIDLVAHLRPDLIDRDYFEELPTLMEAVGPRVIDGIGFAPLPEHFVGTHYFEGFPLFWHVDIDCVAASREWHMDGAYLFRITRWEQRFKMWIEAVQQLMRAQEYGTKEHWDSFEAYLADMKMRITKRHEVSALIGEPREQLSQVLDREIAWHRGQGIGDEKVFLACDSLRREVLAG